MDSLKICSLNCRGLNGQRKRLDTFHYIKKLSCDIVCLQDTHFTKEQFNDIYTEWNGHCIHSTARSNARGVSILFNKKLDYTIHRQLCDENGNFVLIDLSVSKNRFTLATAYFPKSDKPTFIEHLFSAIDSFDNNSYMLCGDFNLVLDPEIDNW